VSEQLKFDYYRVEVSAGESWQDKVIPASPVNPYAGYTTPDVKWEIDTTAQPDGRCTITNVRVELGLTVLLPRIETTDAEASAQASRYYEALKEHEMGHVEIWRKAAAAIDSQLATIPPSADCNKLYIYAGEYSDHYQLMASEQDRAHDNADEYSRVQNSWK